MLSLNGTCAQMTTKETKPTQAIPAWRYNTGLGLFIIGFSTFLATAILGPLFDLNATMIGTLFVVSEILQFSSIFFLGKEGFKRIKGKIFGWMKRKPGEKLMPVGKVRHYVGLILTFVMSAIFNYTALALTWVTFDLTMEVDPAGPMPSIWSIPFEHVGYWIIGFFLAGELMLLMGLVVLGGEWWERFRELLKWHDPDAVKS